MSVEIIGIDHIYIAVTDLQRSEAFYDRLPTLINTAASARCTELTEPKNCFNSFRRYEAVETANRRTTSTSPG
jgi:hypothetical protein